MLRYAKVKPILFDIVMGIIIAMGIIMVGMVLHNSEVIHDNSVRINMIDSTSVSWQKQHDYEIDSVVKILLINQNKILLNQDSIKLLLKKLQDTY